MLKMIMIIIIIVVIIVSIITFTTPMMIITYTKIITEKFY